jgi:hypothetical protein
VEYEEYVEYPPIKEMVMSGWTCTYRTCKKFIQTASEGTATWKTKGMREYVFLSLFTTPSPRCGSVLVNNGL